jgi:hypothetical protein
MRYETVDVTIDDSTIAEGDVWTIIHPVWWLADIYNGPDEYERSLRRFSPEQRLMFALRWYMSEVNNGGHRQFYFNSTGIVWKDACKAFSAINVRKGADIILESADRMGGDPSLEHDLRQAELDQHDPNFRDLDDRFYELEHGTDIEQAMLDFIRRKPAAFHFSGKVTRVVLPDFKNRSRS